ncbi:MAG TPA: pilin [Candidatus Bathyarchaeia archaeon]|nr:pilin [Candidatus Bathyarchaeia archaeon]
MSKLKTLIISTLAVFGFVAVPVLPAFADSSCSSPTDCISQGTNSIGGNSNQPKLEDSFKTIVNVLLFLLGVIAVIMIIIGGIRYTTSNGDASSTKAAKDTILYAVIGLVVAILAYAIVNFIVGAFKGN